MDEIGIIPFQQYENNDHFGLIDFMDDANLDHQFINLIRGESNEIMTHDHHQPILDFTSSQGYDHFDHHNNVGGSSSGGGGGCNINDLFPAAAPAAVELFDFHHVEAAGNSYHHDLGLENALCHEEQIMEEEESSAAAATTTTTTTTANTSPTKKNGSRADRSRTLIAEQRRRGRMKDTLYALRSLVPNITKMDKASIVGDAISYVQDLQMQAKKLKSEIATIESSLKRRGNNNNHHGIRASHNEAVAQDMNVITSFYPITKKIFKMDVFRVEERGFYVRLVTNKGKGVAAFLYKALESLTSFNVRSSNLSASDENYVITFSLHIKKGEMDIDLPNMKMWIASVLLNQGFEFHTSQNMKTDQMLIDPC